jgi:hypothetical protein
MKQLINKIFLKINNISENKLSGNINNSAIMFFANVGIGFIFLYPLNWLGMIGSFLLGLDKSTNNPVYLIMDTVLNNFLSQTICVILAIVMFCYAILYLNRIRILSYKTKTHWIYDIIEFFITTKLFQ